MTTFSEQFKEVYPKGFSSQVRIFSDEGLASHVGKKVDVHMHSPATEKLGRPIYSILHKNRVLGQTDSIHLGNVRMKVNKTELRKHLESPTGAKTRNTFASGNIINPSTTPKNKLKIRAGSMTDGKTGKDVSDGMAHVFLGPVQKYRK